MTSRHGGLDAAETCEGPTLAKNKQTLDTRERASEDEVGDGHDGDAPVG